ncbi:N-acyl homoserine lactonase AttM [Variibacter gotjawalensis]|uniref:N-acyl homoserine lactonase AttM n=1 Tax=Variibacter gotjawalensis TaxID=1333996 RepID=A0A0S3PZX8_9BRAD|nr:N-acyl homoserine lactonase family protein [Variibacter gotjawalensis]NIK47340.1 glyoxylase-like metal-dependent hydrolase (beta-lactamase superfamily II) [Variibacter gotjawalensis]RZS49238.1 metallo-beta-lactamase superfamily protein [Variibacter gotjawalensis]BAT61500.1 N-acyl homoserine lactonase AttM [Variibacter gotjawalensis]
MKMHVLAGGRLRMRRNIYFTDADKSEMIDLPVSAFLLRHPQGNVMFDSGCHPSVAEGPEQAAARWGGMARMMTPVAPPEENVITSLQCVGVKPDDIDLVICSHFHPDHCGCNVFFRKATMLVHAKELEAAQAPDAAQKGYLPTEWDHPNLRQVIDQQHDVFGDSKIVCVPLPGHTPGIVGALVNLDRDGTFLLASDTVSVRAMLDRDVMPKNMWNAEVSAQSIAEVKRIEARGATVLCGHDDAQWQTLRKGADAYE